MSQNKRTVIRTETKEVWVVRRRGGPPEKRTLWCEACRNESEWLTLLDTARLSGITLKEILGLIKAGIIHSHETPHGQPFACANSLVAALRL